MRFWRSVNALNGLLSFLHIGDFVELCVYLGGVNALNGLLSFLQRTNEEAKDENSNVSTP